MRSENLGKRVELHPGCDLWMRGARFGSIVKVGRKFYTVQLDKLKRPVRVAFENVQFLD